MRHSSPVSWLVAAAAACAVAGCAAPSHFTKPQSPDRFTACAPAPHCVSSQAAPGSFHYVEPFRFTGSAAVAHRALSQMLRNVQHATVEKDDGNFVHATFQTTIGFVDDVTFVIKSEEHFIDVKSSSRIGFSDLGVNHRRVEGLRKQFEALLQNE
ncbi:MAG: DUF1499 domain-containing protein [Rhodanobacter sp.]